MSPEPVSASTSNYFVLVLEDDAVRLDRFRKALNLVDSRARLMCWRDANQMVREACTYLPESRLISLDHDLYQDSQDSSGDPGDGLVVAKFLASREPQCPVIVHSSNGDRARMMIGELEFSGWSVRRVAPLGQDWVEAYWGVVVRSLLAGV